MRKLLHPLGFVLSLIALIIRIQRKRKDLKLIVSSATLDAEKFAAFFNTNKTSNKEYDTSTILSIRGRQVKKIKTKQENTKQNKQKIKK